MRTNGNDFTGLWVPSSFSSLPSPYLKRSKTPEFDDLVLIQARLYLFEILVKDIVDIFAIYTELIVDILDDLSFRQFVAGQT